MRSSCLILVGLLVMLNGLHPAQAAATPVVLELFTSQGCSSCPPADALLRDLAAGDPALLPLSFHVHYWDYLGWKDPFSSTANTDRQKTYARSLSDWQVFTPQLIVNGAASTIGSREGDVRDAIARAKRMPVTAEIAITPNPNTGQLTVTLSGKEANPLQGAIDIWGIAFNRHSSTNVKAGENDGRRLESINNVTGIKRLAVWQPTKGNLTIPLDASSDDGLAIIAQEAQQGRILGAASYLRP